MLNTIRQSRPHLNIITQSKKKSRLDIALLEKGLVNSRTKAQATILSGEVHVNGLKVTKVGTLVSEDSVVEIIKPKKFVSRGGDKLLGALIDFKLDPKDHVCIDVGSSTGGFTDCLLQKGAKKVYCIDVGRAQLIDSIKNHPHVVAMEETHIRNVSLEQFEDKITWSTIDVSFISLKRVLPKVKMLLEPKSTILALLKPQFEVGAKNLKKGVVRSEEIRQQALTELISFCKDSEINVLGHTNSKIKGPKGNQEFFLNLKT